MVVATNLSGLEVSTHTRSMHRVSEVVSKEHNVESKSPGNLVSRMYVKGKNGEIRLCPLGIRKDK